MRRWSLAHALFAVGLIAMGLAAVHNATRFVAEASLYVLYGILVVSGVGAVVRRRRPETWRGFTLVGWAYFLPIFAFGSSDVVTNTPTNAALAAYVSRVRPRPVPPVGFGIAELGNATISYTHHGTLAPATFRSMVRQYNAAAQASMKVGHVLVTLILAFLGSMLGGWLGRRRPGERDSTEMSRVHD